MKTTGNNFQSFFVENACTRRKISKRKAISSDTTTMELWYNIVGWILAVVAVVGNGLVIFLITTKERLHTTANWFILSLGVADFGVGIVFFPYYVVCDVRELCFYEANFLQTFLMFVLMASTFNLCAMTADRYIAIVKPLKYTNLMSTKCIFTVIAVAWISSFLLATTRSVILFPSGKKKVNTSSYF